jgi:hypothetical protein
MGASPQRRFTFEWNPYNTTTSNNTMQTYLLKTAKDQGQSITSKLINIP